MAWNTPLTAVANAALTAAQWNASVRDNLLETAPAKATASGRFFATTGANSIAERIPSGIQVSGGDTTTATSYGNLAGGANPVATTVCGPTVMVAIGATIQNSVVNTNTFASYAISGANTVAGGDTHSIGGMNPTAGAVIFSGSRVRIEVSLTPGTNTFTEVYRVAAGTGTFSNRHIGIIPF
jgi:hypothetical protein